MELYYIVIGILIILAILDLVVGVSNDAVNFLNSAIGSRVASFRTILIVASVGILLGSGFSAGMMQVARSGIFNPGFFNFEQVIVIFAAVMITDVLLLDIYNSLGLPTSTTVSLVFELLGASFVVSLIHMAQQDMALSELANAINYSSAITIVSSIFLSVGLAFVAGSILQFFFRVTFSFRLKGSVQRFGAVFSGLALTVIVYFLLIKGAEGSALISKETGSWITANTKVLMLVTFLSVTFILFLLQQFKIVNPLKVVVLAGTFALAMAFAGNDLVNFIGVSVGALVAFQAWLQSGVAADAFNMQILATQVGTPTWFLMVSGVIMIITLWTNAKSRKVTETEVSLGRQDEGDENFSPNFISRALVGGSLLMGRGMSVLVPNSLQQFVQRRMRPLKPSKKRQKKSFDLLRAAVNLLVASALIAYGTSQHLPLSTTFVTFMVAMGSSLADRAWGLESAVYRVAGVITVIGSWFVTALVAFLSAGIMAAIFYFTGQVGIIVLFAVAVGLLIKSHLLFQKKTEQENVELPREDRKTVNDFLKDSARYAVRNLKSVSTILDHSLQLFLNPQAQDKSEIQREHTRLKTFNQKINSRILRVVRSLGSANLPVGRFNLSLFDYTQDMAQSIELIYTSILHHRQNLHGLPKGKLRDEIQSLREALQPYFRSVRKSIRKPSVDGLAALKEQHQKLEKQMNQVLDQHVVSLQSGEVSSRLALLQTKVLLETQDLIENAYRIATLHQSLVIHPQPASSAINNPNAQPA
ncbi:MAG: inorganic phosphate transporter [Cyclobacteriaceae bacterium]|jgi:phosphate/sulfate permease|nr:inorganic phosphate transporter [Flammeovirgaceae bacterium]